MKSFKQFLLENEANYEKYLQRYPKIQGNTWRGMELLPLGSSVNSISASFNDYQTLPGFRELPYSDFAPIKPNYFYAANDHSRAEQLTEKIRYSQRIEPLIIAVDLEGPWILEGAHRFWALSKLGFDHFPALVVIGMDD